MQNNEPQSETGDLCAPDPDGLIRTCRDNPATIRHETQTIDGTGVANECVEQLSGQAIPELDGMVCAGGGKQLTVGRKGKSGDRSGVAVKRADISITDGREQFDAVIGASGSDEVSLRCDGDAGHFA